jgi:hypothetical protein
MMQVPSEFRATAAELTPASSKSLYCLFPIVDAIDSNAGVVKLADAPDSKSGGVYPP